MLARPSWKLTSAMLFFIENCISKFIFDPVTNVMMNSLQLVVILLSVICNVLKKILLKSHYQYIYDVAIYCRCCIVLNVFSFFCRSCTFAVTQGEFLVFVMSDTSRGSIITIQQGYPRNPLSYKSWGELNLSPNITSCACFVYMFKK